MGPFSFLTLDGPIFFEEIEMKGDQAVFRKAARKLYCFADSVELCTQLLNGGAEIIQLRAKELEKETFTDLAKEMQRTIRRHAEICGSNVLFIINDRAEIALSLDVDGIHLGQDDRDYHDIIREAPAHMSVGVSVKTVSQALEAQESGAAYVGAGAVFATSTKKDTRVIGLQRLHEITTVVDIPVVAIGGITLENISQTVHQGASYFAVISAINQAADIPETITSFKKEIEQS